MKNKKVAILGAGIAGLSAAFKLGDAGVEYKLFEKNERPGGLLDSFSVGDFRFDHAVHLSFATEPEVRKIFDQTPFYTHKPESRCYDNGLWLRHPVQNNLYPLQVDIKVDLIKGFIERPDLEINSYGDWLDYQFGYQISEKYPRRYTLKYWGVSADELGVDWIGNRMHRATIEQVLEGAMTSAVPNYYYTKEMRYPKKGGYISFLAPLLEKVNVSTRKELVEVDLDAKLVEFSDGETFVYDSLINTIPLPDFISKIKSVPESIRLVSEKLRWTRVYLVSIGFNKPDLVKDLWAYIYDEDIFASRYYSPSIKSPDNCPTGKSSIQFEIYEDSINSKNFEFDVLLENTLYAIEKMGISNREAVEVKDVRLLEYGNVTFYRGMEEDRKKILDWLGGYSVFSAGRFGCWDYLWSNQAMVSGFNAADSIL